MATVEMNLANPILGELAFEAASTRKALERVPEDKFDWAPHPKSMKLGFLASHIAEIPKWGAVTLLEEEMNFDPSQYKPWMAASRQELLDAFDKNVAEFRATLSGYPNDKFMVPWRLKVLGETRFEMPRASVLRSMVLNHLVHHRAQLSVYLRLLDIPVPAIYGPSGDEQG